MKVIDSLYVKGIKDKKINKFVSKIKNNKIVNGIYVITLPIFDDGILEIYSYLQFKQKFYSKFYDDIVVVGIAKNKEDADMLVLDIVQQLYDADCGFDIRRFLEV